MDKYITILTIIPWIILFIVSIRINLNRDYYLTFSFKSIKKNFFQIVRINTLFLIIVFWYFASFNKIFVDKYLFAIICIEFLVNLFYESKPKNTFEWKKNIGTIIAIIIITIIPIFFIYDDLTNVYKYLLIIYFLEYPLILVASYINKKIRYLTKS